MARLTKEERDHLRAVLDGWRKSIDDPTTAPIEVHSADVALLQRLLDVLSGEWR